MDDSSRSEGGGLRLTRSDKFKLYVFVVGVALLIVSRAHCQSPYVTLTGTLQGPNGLPAANQIISMTPTQQFFVAGSGGSNCAGYSLEINGVVLTCGDTVDFNNTNPVAPPNGLNIQWNKFSSTGIDYVSAALVGDGNAAHCLNGTGAWSACSGGTSITVNGGAALGTPVNFQNSSTTTITNPSGNNVQVNVTTGLPAAQIGDTIRYNVNGDSSWDPTNYAQKTQTIWADYTANSLICTGCYSAVALASGASWSIPSSFTSNDAVPAIYSVGGTASTSTVLGMECCSNGNYGGINLAAWYRWSARFAAGNTANVRYWIGLTTWLNGGIGSEGTPVLNSTKMATDSPQSTTLGFRYSAGTDSNWQCVSAISNGGGQTTVNTGVAIDTNVHTFEMAYGSGTTLYCYIDQRLVGTITTNLPPVTGDSVHGQLFYTADNKNTATAISNTFYYEEFSPK